MKALALFTPAEGHGSRGIGETRMPAQPTRSPQPPHPVTRLTRTDGRERPPSLRWGCVIGSR